MKIYRISDLIPLEDYIRDYSLRFLTQVFRNLNSFSDLRDKPYVFHINKKNYLDDGNHRSVWNLINGIETIEAEEEIPDEKRIKSTLVTVESVRRNGINSFFDLVRTVEDPEQYSRFGSITHKIRAEDLTNPEYFLSI